LRIVFYGGCSGDAHLFITVVCFPGGMVDEDIDGTIIQTSLREMEEELGISPDKVEVLGILRCDWTEVASVTGISVTPVVGFIGDISDLVLQPNPDEVEQLFTIPIKDVADERNWVRKELSTPVFNGGML
jgi:nudix motif 8